jgi:hypothetical protein
VKTLRDWLILTLVAASAGTILRAQPDNDNFAAAIPLGTATLVGNDINATFQSGEPNNGATNTVWWSWTAPNSGLAWVDLDGSSGEFYVGVYTGPAVSFLLPVAGNPFNAVAHTTYYVQVSGYGSNAIAISVQPEGMSILNYQTFLNGDNTETFWASTEVANSGTSPQTIQIDIVARAGYSATQTGIEAYSLPEDLPPDELLGSYYITNLAAGAETNLTLSNTCPAPDVVDFVNYGVGWDIFLDFKGSYQHSVRLFSGDWPVISGTNGSGGGVSRFEPTPTNETQAPLEFVSGVINGPASVPENSSTNYTGTVKFTNGFIGGVDNFSNANWTVSPDSPFAIATNGIFSAGTILTNTPVTITANYFYNGTNYPISTNITVLVLPSPVIVSQPANQAVGMGQPADFAVTATGDAPLFYQWNFDDNAVPGATNSALVLPATQLTNSGTYSVVVSNAAGVAVSSNATLAVAETTPPTVTIVNPSPAGPFSTYDPRITISGTASDLVAVTQVLISDNTNAFQTATGASNWSATVTLAPGTNLISVMSVNPADISSLAATQVIILDSIPTVAGLGLLTNGAGTIKHSTWPKGGLVIGKSYAVTATPAPDNLFSNWTGGTNFPYTALSASAKYTFAMKSNLVLEANFVANPFIPVTGTYNGLFTNAGGVTEQTAGMLKGLSITQKGTYSGSLLINGASHAVSGSFDLAGQATNHISRTASQGGPLVLARTFLTSSNAAPQVTGAVSGTANGAQWTANLIANQAANSRFQGNYTMLIPPDTNNAPFNLSPGGNGYALIADSATTAKITGALADGTVFSQTAPVSLDGYIPIYTSLYGGKGLLLGLINLDLTNTSGVGLAWLHPETHSGLYQQGFTNVLQTNQILFSPWTNPPADSTLAKLTKLSMFDTTNDAGTPITVSISSGKVTGESVSGTLNLKTGLLKVTIGSGSAKTTGYGTILLNATNGGGYFATKTNAGAIQLGP